MNRPSDGTYAHAHPMTPEEKSYSNGYTAGWNDGFSAGRGSALPRPKTRAHWEMCTGKDARCGDINIHDPHPVRVDDD